MSLVAYGSSDEESDEDVQNHQDDTKKPLLTEEGKDPAEGKGLVLPSPKQTSKLSSFSDRKSALSSILPKPKNVGNIEEGSGMGKQTIPDNKTPPVSLETTLEDEEILEIEEEYEPIAKRAKKVSNSEVNNKPKSVGSLFSLLPAPWQAENTWQKKKESKISAAGDKRSKQSVKIAIPTAPKVMVHLHVCDWIITAYWDIPVFIRTPPMEGNHGHRALGIFFQRSRQNFEPLGCRCKLQRFRQQKTRVSEYGLP